MDAAEAEDTLDLRTLDQLHAVVLEFSKTSQELKKLCVGRVTAVPALIFALTDSKLDASIFIAGLVIAVTFWLVDAYTYFYQDKVRNRMSEVADTLRTRSGSFQPAEGMGMPVSGRTPATRLRRSLFNPSQLIYGLLATVSAILWVLYIAGVINS
jgi:hypothetical protein